MRICIIGSTGHYNLVFSGIKEEKNIQIVGVAPGSEGDRAERVLNKAVSLGYSPQYFEDYIKMLDELKPDIAVVSCYFGDHAKVTVEAIKRNIHVFVEKPVATTLKDLDRVKSAYNNANVHLATMFGLRYKPWFLTAHKVVKDGAIGDIRLMNAQKSYTLGIRGPHVKQRETYGGTIPWVGSHAIDWLYWFSGEKFQSVYASHSTRNNGEYESLETSAICQYKLSNDIFASVSMDYFRPENAPSESDDRIRIVGTKGIIEVRDRKVLLINDEKAGIQEVPLLEERHIFADFLNQIRGKGKCMVSAKESFYVTEACLRARQSADCEEVVFFDNNNQ